MPLDDSASSGALPLGATTELRLPPLPYRFKPRRSVDILFAQWLRKGEHPITNRRPRGNTAARKAGHRYEKKVKEALVKAVPALEWHSGEWIQYLANEDNGHAKRTYYCQPDIVGLDNAEVWPYPRIHIFEIKYTLTTDAWWQLTRLYAPVLERMYPRHAPHLHIVCKNYSPELKSLLPDAPSWGLSFHLHEFVSGGTKRIIVWGRSR